MKIEPSENGVGETKPTIEVDDIPLADWRDEYLT